MRAMRNSAETQPSDLAQRSESEIKDGGSKDGAPERLKRRTIQMEVS